MTIIDDMNNVLRYVDQCHVTGAHVPSLVRSEFANWVSFNKTVAPPNSPTCCPPPVLPYSDTQRNDVPYHGQRISCDESENTLSPITVARHRAQRTRSHSSAPACVFISMKSILWQRHQSMVPENCQRHESSVYVIFWTQFKLTSASTGASNVAIVCLAWRRPFCFLSFIYWKSQTRKCWRNSSWRTNGKVVTNYRVFDAQRTAVHNRRNEHRTCLQRDEKSFIHYKLTSEPNYSMGWQSDVASGSSEVALLFGSEPENERTEVQSDQLHAVSRSSPFRAIWWLLTLHLVRHSLDNETQRQHIEQTTSDAFSFSPFCCVLCSCVARKFVIQSKHK